MAPSGELFYIFGESAGFFGLQPAGLQRGGEAPCGELENTTSVNFRFFPLEILPDGHSMVGLIIYFIDKTEEASV